MQMKETQFHWPSEADEVNNAPLRVKKMSTYTPGDVAYIHGAYSFHKREHREKGCDPSRTNTKSETSSLFWAGIKLLRSLHKYTAFTPA